MPKKRHKAEKSSNLPYWESKVKEEADRPRWKTNRWKFEKPSNTANHDFFFKSEPSNPEPSS